MVLFVDRHLYMLHIFVCICIYTYTYISKKPRKYCKSNCNLRSLPIISPGLTVTEKEIIMQFKLLHSLISALFLVLFSCFHCSSGSQGWHLHFGGGHQSKLSASEVLCQKKYICVGGFFFSLGSFWRLSYNCHNAYTTFALLIGLQLHATSQLITNSDFQVCWLLLFCLLYYP